MTYIDLNNLRNARTGSFENSSNVLAAHLGLLADSALDQVSRGVSGDLARDEDLAVGLYGLGLLRSISLEDQWRVLTGGDRYVCDVGCVRRRFLEWAVIREGDE